MLPEKTSAAAFTVPVRGKMAAFEGVTNMGLPEARSSSQLESMAGEEATGAEVDEAAVAGTTPCDITQGGSAKDSVDGETEGFGRVSAMGATGSGRTIAALGDGGTTTDNCGFDEGRLGEINAELVDDAAAGDGAESGISTNASDGAAIYPSPPATVRTTTAGVDAVRYGVKSAESRPAPDDDGCKADGRVMFPVQGGCPMSARHGSKTF